ncbi:MAG: YraN family protein [Patescibacteria group bacterium]
MKSANNKTGNIGEKVAANYLLKNGYAIIDKNFRIKLGEIDIIATKNNVIHFIEVKTRSSTFKGFPYEQVNSKKLRKITKVTEYYSKIKKLTEFKHSIDIVSIELDNQYSNHVIKIYENVTN